MTWLRSSGARFWSAIKPGRVYRVEGYHTGDFTGEVLRVDRDIAQVRVVDPMRPIPRVRNRCSFPECVRADFHGGDHEFVSVRQGALLQVSVALTKWIPIDSAQSSGDGQLATLSGLMPTPSSLATSPSRKVRRSA